MQKKIFNAKLPSATVRYQDNLTTSFVHNAVPQSTVDLPYRQENDDIYDGVIGNQEAVQQYDNVLRLPPISNGKCNCR